MPNNIEMENPIRIVIYKHPISKNYAFKYIKKLLSSNDIFIKKDKDSIWLKKKGLVALVKKNDDDSVIVYLNKADKSHLAEIIFTPNDDLYKKIIGLIDRLILEKEKRDKNWLTRIFIQSMDWLKIRLAKLI